jgi:hypothetical protein
MPIVTVVQAAVAVQMVQGKKLEVLALQAKATMVEAVVLLMAVEAVVQVK